MTIQQRPWKGHLPGSDGGETLSSILASRAVSKPDELVYIFLRDGESDEERLTYRELHHRAAGFAFNLANAVEPGSRALLLFPPGLDYVAALFGCFHAGVVAVPVAPPHPRRLHRTLPRLLSIAGDADAQCVVTTPEIKDAAAPFLEQAGPLAHATWITEALHGDLREEVWGHDPRPGSELALLQYTSGSTSVPRGVMLTHDHLIGMCRMLTLAWDAGPDDLGFNWLPPYHDMGLISLLETVFHGVVSVITSPLAIIKRPMRWPMGISRYHATVSGGPNFAYDMCVERFDAASCEDLDLSSWAIAANGAEPIRASTLDAFTDRFGPYGFQRQAFFPCYGLAEATLLVTGIPRDRTPVLREFSVRALEQGVARDGTPGDGRTLVGCGAPDGRHRVVIVDPDTLTRCRPNQVGEIWVTGPSVAGGYWRAADATDRVFGCTLADEPGGSTYLRTGDLGALIDGELYVVGRIKDLLIVNGRNVHPHDVEASAEAAHDRLRTHCCAAFVLGEDESEGPLRLAIVAEIDDHEDTEIDEVIAAVRRRIAFDFELSVDTVALCSPGSVPKTTSGKIQRSLCERLLSNDELELVGAWRAET